MIAPTLIPKSSLTKQVDDMSNKLNALFGGNSSSSSNIHVHHSISKQPFANDGAFERHVYTRKSTSSTDLRQQHGILMKPTNGAGSRHRHTRSLIPPKPAHKERPSGTLVRRQTAHTTTSRDLTAEEFAGMPRICTVPDSDVNSNNNDVGEQPPAAAAVAAAASATTTKWQLRRLQQERRIEDKRYLILPLPAITILLLTPTRSCKSNASAATASDTERPLSASHVWGDAFWRDPRKEYPPIVKEMRSHNSIVVKRGRFEIRLEAFLSQ